jgi:hypothetical protein
MTAAVATVITPQERGCPNHDPLRNFLTGRLAESEAESVEVHLVGCASCLDRLEEFSARERQLGSQPGMLGSRKRSRPDQASVPAPGQLGAVHLQPPRYPVG